MSFIRQSKMKTLWAVGSTVRALYSVDGQYYTAQILDIQKDSALVDYKDFPGSQEWVLLSKLKN